MEQRQPYLRIWSALASEKAMVFISGPRQSGKTTLAGLIAGQFRNHLYCNWDIPSHQSQLIDNPTFFTGIPRHDASRPLIVFDEIHKYRNWKNYLKGAYDECRSDYQFLVTGSGRLDLYQRGGDSLAGRYLQFQLWPLTIGELGNANREMDAFLRDPLLVSLDRQEELSAIWDRLETLSGFPEPYLNGRVASYRRWSATYSQGIVREDIRDMTGIRSVSDVETLFNLLPSKVGNPLSLPSLARDLKLAYTTVQSWLSVMERFYLTFALTTWTERIARAIQKERKVYLFDVPRVKDPAARFENQVALELWRAVSCWNAMGAGDFAVHFIRNKEHQEVDFLVTNNREPVLLAEAKLADERPTEPLLKMQRALRVPAVQLVRNARTFKTYTNDSLPVVVAPASCWLAALPM
ncbi:MAG: ATP-binding protein [Acidobacteria bacterium]|nr:ATP-binding protein [Acidobacteriota bacterium]